MRKSKRTIVASAVLFFLADSIFVFGELRNWYRDHGFRSVDQAYEFALSSKPIRLVVACRDLPIGAVPTAQDLKAEVFYIPKQPADTISNLTEVIGAPVVVGIQKNEIVAHHHFGLRQRD